MRNTLIFSGTSCPSLTRQICDNLGVSPAPAELTQFSNGETSVRILQSVREKDVFVVQSGSPNVNDTVMELLIMISACKGGSATKVTAVLPYLPYGRQSKKKSHRGAITARLLANLLDVAGVKHIISVDLHATQMQGFFKCPIDNLHAEPLIARWIRQNVADWKDGVVVSKNAGGTKRVTSLADALKLSFGIITTDKRRGNKAGGSMMSSLILGHVGDFGAQPFFGGRVGVSAVQSGLNSYPPASPSVPQAQVPATIAESKHNRRTEPYPSLDVNVPRSATETVTNGSEMPLVADREDASPTDDHLVQDVTHGRLVQGRIVDDSFPSQDASSANSVAGDDPMMASRASSFFAHGGESLVGSDNGAAISDEEEDVLKDPTVEHMITLVGDVKHRPVFIVDDMIDKPQSWIAAAEACVKRGYAKKVYCMATHGVFGGDCLEQLQACECIHTVVVTNSIPIDMDQAGDVSKLVILDLSFLLSEAIRRNHYGESISSLFRHMIN